MALYDNYWKNGPVLLRGLNPSHLHASSCRNAPFARVSGWSACKGSNSYSFLRLYCSHAIRLISRLHVNTTYGQPLKCTAIRFLLASITMNDSSITSWIRERRIFAGSSSRHNGRRISLCEGVVDQHDEACGKLSKRGHIYFADDVWEEGNSYYGVASSATRTQIAVICTAKAIITRSKLLPQREQIGGKDVTAGSFESRYEAFVSLPAWVYLVWQT